MTADAFIDSPVEEILAGVSRLATLPEVTTRILETIDDPDATADALEDLIAGDPVLSARVLKVVNSAFYGSPATVDTIKQAVVMLGLGGVKNIALAASFAKLFGGRQTIGKMDPQGPWLHSTAVAATAKLISRHTGGDGNALFLAGLLHDVGTLMLMQVKRSDFIRLLQATESDEGETYSSAELRIFGATHEEVGAALCRKWNFPQSIQDSISFHHNPGALEGEAQRNALVVGLADRLAAEAGIGYCCAAKENTLIEQIGTDLGLTDTQLAEIREQLPAATQFAEQFAA